MDRTISNSINAKLKISIIALLISAIFLLEIYSAHAEVTWGNFMVFKGSSSPYASNGPGCKKPGPSQTTQSMMIPGQNCPNGSNAVYDLGAVWVDMDETYIAWQVYAPNLSDTKFCGGIKESPDKSLPPPFPPCWQLLIEFDADDNQMTGCNMGEPCYPGADYQIWVGGNGTDPKFWKFDLGKRSNGSCTSGDCFTAAEENETNNVTFNYTCGNPNQPYILRLAINKSAISTLSGMNFMVSTLNCDGTGPVESLGGVFGGMMMDKIMMGGPMDMMFMDEHPCMAYDGNETGCANNSNNYNCTWNSFERICNPDFSKMGCSEFCGACTDKSTCLSGAQGKCIDVTAPPMTPPGTVVWNETGTMRMCVEDQQKFMMGGSGSCDSDCKFCYSESTCNSSVFPSPMGGKGCKWVTDPYFGKSWCDLSTFDITKFNCGQSHLDRCMNETGCTDALGNWSDSYKVCHSSNASIEYLCFDGEDNDGDNLIDCKDPDCKRDPSCGGDISMLTSGFNINMNPFDAMKMQMFQGMDPSPPIDIAFTPQNWTNIKHHFDVTGFRVKDMGTSFGMGIRVADMAGMGNSGSSWLCAADNFNSTNVKYYYFMDSDANLSTGCNATISGGVYYGFEYKFEYEIRNGSNSGTFPANDTSIEIRRGYRCMPDYNYTFSLFPAKLAGAPPMQGFGDLSFSCAEDTAIIAVDKADIGNPKGNMRFIAAASDENTSVENANDSITGKEGNGIYYTLGAADFKPKDCFSNPMACGTAFSIIGGGKFMPFEDCMLGTGDEDLDSLTNCNDSDCIMAPWCAGQYNLSNDKTAPTVVGNRVETFMDFVFMHWTTNEPTNATVSLYTTSCTNSVPNYTLYDLGDIGFTFDDYRPWHDKGIKNGEMDSNNKVISISSGTTYFYKLTACDKSGNCAVSGCLNFTTASVMQNFQYKFDFIPPTDNVLMNNTLITIFNGTGYINITSGEAQNNSNYMQDARLKFDNPGANWNIELEGINFAKAVNFNLSSAFNVTNESGKTYIGMGNQKWLDMAQNLGVQSIILQIPGTGNKLIKCNENNLSDCSDVSAQAELNETGADYTKWKIPVSLGFSTYTLESETYNLTFTNTTSNIQNVSFGQIASFSINITNNDNVTRNYTLTVVVNGSATGTINGSASKEILFNSSGSSGAIYAVEANITDTTAESVAFVVKATLTNNSAAFLNSSQDVNFTAIFFRDTVGPLLTVSSPANATYYNSTNISLNYSVSDDINVSTCWYTNITGTNVTLANCVNTTFIANGGYYNITVYVNDTSNNTNSSQKFFWTDVNTPKLPSVLNATVNTNGSIFLNWSTVSTDVNGSDETTVTYRIFKSTINSSGINTTMNSSNYIGETTAKNYTDANVAAGTYYYAITAIDHNGHYNNSLGTNRSATAACSSSWSSWNTCSSSSQSRTKSCFNATESESQSCTESNTGSGGSSDSSLITYISESQTLEKAIAGKSGIFTFEKGNRTGITEISVKFKNDKSNVKIIISETANPIRILPIAAADGKVYKYVKITPILIENSEIDGLTITFKVLKSWLTSNSLQSEGIVLMHLKTDNTWEEFSARGIGSDSSYNYYEGDSAALSTFAIAGKKVVPAAPTPTPAQTLTPTKELPSEITPEIESATRACQSAREVRRRKIELIYPLTRFFICK
ncbi:MAG: PGF-pre-PGF domain-containing protein [Candidatus Woesearchaeota archaeon]|nr:PGF-pre-PGF domain-containing protein [Candidatus Woesearchaeota archaeon]